uniref:Uncharacterized protein n=1 Tax=Physcomitrium patens TaxID=3218 RepID=A0A2K1JC70_PHYPA|nr:hypothetical protein PHYPA_019386 [Physcomitrium patens]
MLGSGARCCCRGSAALQAMQQQHQMQHSGAGRCKERGRDAREKYAYNARSRAPRTREKRVGGRDSGEC